MCAWLTVGILFSPLVAFAQVPPHVTDPSAQELQRQQERERTLREQQEQTPDVRLPRRVLEEFERLPEEEKPCFPIKEIELGGDAADRFQWAVAAANPLDDPAVNRCLGTRGISLVMRRIQNTVVAKGYVTTRVLASPQDLREGKLVLTVIPGRIRQVRFSKYSAGRANEFTVFPASPGDILNLRDIEQALENFKRVPSAEADIKIMPADGPGAKPGESDLVITWKQSRPLRLNVTADDSGNKATGKYQGGVTLSYDNPFALNDLLYVNYGHDLGGGKAGPKGTESWTAHYSIPYGYWLLGLTWSKYDFHQNVAGTVQDYQYSGASRSGEIRLSRLFYRDAVRKSTAFAKGWQRTSSNYIDDTEVEIQHRRMAGWEAGLNHREFVGAAVLDATVGYKRGTGAKDSLRAPEEAFGEGTSRPEITLANVQFSIPFSLGSQRASYTLNWRAQWNHTPLVPQDRFSIGGRYTVRGFDGEMTLMGDRGRLVRNDLGFAVADTGAEVYLGVDYGEVKGPSTRYILGRYLAGAAVGLRGGYKGFNWDLFAGTPIAKPDGFRTAGVTAGFSAGWSY